MRDADGAKVMARTDLTIEKSVRLSPHRAFQLISAPEFLPSWWGPKGITLGEHDLDFTRVGSWSSVMIEPENGWHRVSGEVLCVTAGEAVELSWAWQTAKPASVVMKAGSAWLFGVTGRVVRS